MAFPPLLAVLPAVLLAAVVPAHAAESSFAQIDLFEAGTGGYSGYRVPALLITGQGTLLAFGEARRTFGDWSDIDIKMRRSTDGGKTWDEPQTVVDAGDKPASNAVPIWDRATKAVLFLYQTSYAAVYCMRSDDDGKTFSAPADITPALEKFREKYNWHVIAPGPGHGIQLSNGRIVVPVWMGFKVHDHRPSVLATIYSDDHGKTWQCGEILPETFKNMSETTLIERSDGRVMLFIRNEDPGMRVATSVGADGASGWSQPTLHEELYTPICFSSVLTLTRAPESSKNRVLFCNPDSRNKTATILKWGARARENVSVKLSYDDGKTWPVQKSIEPAHSGYSDLAVGPDGSIYCLYERGDAPTDKMGFSRITIAKFNLEWITDGKDSLAGEKVFSAPATPPVR